MLKFLMAPATRRAVWEAIVLVGVGLLIMLAGPLMAFDGARPLADLAARWRTLAVIIALWLLARWLPRLLYWRRQKRLFRRLAGADSASSTQRSEERLLPDSFKRTFRLLRHRQFGGGGPLRRYCRRFGKGYVYQLPWFLVLGTDASGKNKALQNAGLDYYHSLQEINSLSLEDKPDNHCDWYLTSHGVLLSPAGAYLQDGNRYWRQMIDLLSRYRARQPINGVVLAINAQDVLHASPDGQYRQAVLLRKRLVELRRRFKIDFPLYFMMTKTDCLPGFSHYFSRYDGPDLEQCWGMTLPWPGGMQPEISLRQALDEGWDRLQTRLNAALADTLAAERDPWQRAQILAFPQAFAALRPQLLRNLSTICLPSGDGPALSPRGLFFTSANQKDGGKTACPIPRDNIFDYSYAPQDQRFAWDEQETPAPQSYFLKSLFREIVLAEGGLAGRNRWAAYRRRLATAAGCSLLLLTIGLAVGGSLRSYRHNLDYLARVEEKIEALARQSARLDFNQGAGLADLVRFLDDLRRLVCLDGFDPAHPPLDYRMGMYRGEQMASAGESLYQHALKRLLLPLAAQHITRLLYQIDFDDAELTYGALTAYQMLYQPDHYDRDGLLAWLTDTLPAMPDVAELDEARRERLRRHLGHLLSSGPPASPYVKDTRLERAARQAVQKTALPVRAYARLKNRLLQDDRFTAISLTELAGEQGDWVFERKSGLANYEPLPGFYTPEGYWLGVNAQARAVVDELAAQDGWVLGHAPSGDGAAMADQVRLLYMNDFIRQWEQFLGDITIKPSLSLHQRIGYVRVLSGDQSPLRELLLNIGRTVSLPAPQTGEFPAGVGELGQETRRVFNRMFARAQPDPGTAAPEQMARNHFRDIIALTRSPQPGSDGVSFGNVLKGLDSLYHYLVALDVDDNAAGRQDAILTRLRADALRLPAPFRQLVLTLVSEAGDDARHQTMQRLYRLFDLQIAGFYQFALKGRYPLAPNGKQDISPDDFAHMFAPGVGLADRFFDRYLADKINTREQPWRFMPWAQADGSPGEKQLLAFFQAAAAIRDAFFRQGGQGPSFSFTLRPLSMDNRIISLEMDIDGQPVAYHHGPPAVFHLNWPGLARAFQAQATLTLSSGATKTVRTEGPWAWHRLLANAGARWDGRHIASRAVFMLNGSKATLEIVADSARNPFALPPLDDIMQQETM
ncbi:type VI secretion system membrane subunit TssM [Martelella alba]|uniref:Type VI secretion system membrane subunit TssM n=1 Tax=Martelella alba TaxID=2590451 RepID=A0ABY2SHX4_9HYPH|nr:type VI secretion system membrane subunit TssM [Martelella alba]TKI04331.1 type VI secretion system membrane subunit TssM [Martelella alba]